MESWENHGSLPVYAQKGNKRKLVKLLCRKCRATRWAEMNIDYPGRDVLSMSDEKQFVAHCLKCGKAADDSYNWFR